jgi:hypothetical protein
MKRAVLLASIFPFLVISCNTTGYGYGRIGLNGMVYDFENKPVSQYFVKLDDRLPVSTDINGRFYISNVRRGKHRITGRKSGFETYQGEIEINDRSQIAYFRVPNLNQLITLTDDALSRNRINEAASYIRRAESIGEITTELLFYSAVVLFRMGEYKESIAILQNAEMLGSKDEYVSRFLNELLERYGDKIK